MHYSMVIKWSGEDEMYVATCPEFGSGINALGKTASKAARELEKAVALVIEVYKEDRRRLPRPRIIKATKEGNRKE